MRYSLDTWLQGGSMANNVTDNGGSAGALPGFPAVRNTVICPARCPPELTVAILPFCKAKVGAGMRPAHPHGVAVPLQGSAHEEALARITEQFEGAVGALRVMERRFGALQEESAQVAQASAQRIAELEREEADAEEVHAALAAQYEGKVGARQGVWHACGSPARMTAAGASVAHGHPPQPVHPVHVCAHRHKLTCTPCCQRQQRRSLMCSEQSFTWLQLVLSADGQAADGRATPRIFNLALTAGCGAAERTG